MIAADEEELQLFETRHYQNLPKGMHSYLKLRFGGAAVGRDGFTRRTELQTAMEKALADYHCGIITDDMLKAASRTLNLRKLLYDDYQDAMTYHMSLCRAADDARDFISWSDLFEDFEDYQMQTSQQKEVCHAAAVHD